MKKSIGVGAVLLMAAMFAGAAEWRALSVAESAAAGGANRVYSMDYSDLTESTVNTAQTLTVAVPAKAAVMLTLAVMDTAFDTAATNVTSCAVTIGDGTDADLFLASMELASDGTEVWKKYGQAASSLTLGKKVYTEADTIDVVFTPDAAQALSAMSSGQVLFYFLVQ